MIRVFVVDDERLVRRGIISTIDWERYDMSVIGEADNGENALAFLEAQTVDLLFTDLTMPGLSGFDFLETVRIKYPNLPIVVLTMHQDFEFCQMAFRLGVLDYITKAQLEADNLDAVMRNISLKYEKVTQGKGSVNTLYSSESVFLLWGSEIELLNEKEKLSDSSIASKLISENLLLIETAENNFDRALLKNKNNLFIEVSLSHHIPLPELEQQLLRLIPAGLFSKYCKGQTAYKFDLDGLIHFYDTELVDKSKVQEDFCNAEVLKDSDLFRQTITNFLKLRFIGEVAIVFFYNVNLHWTAYTGRLVRNYFNEVKDFHWWYQWHEWLQQIRGSVCEKLGAKKDDSQDRKCIEEALSYIHKNYNSDLTADFIMTRIGMCRTNFFKTFKEVTGKTFVSYLNALRIEAAKRYLVESDKPVYWISEYVGFRSERYFRQVFEAVTGELPLKFRKKYSKSS